MISMIIEGSLKPMRSTYAPMDDTSPADRQAVNAVETISTRFMRMQDGMRAGTIYMRLPSDGRTLKSDRGSNQPVEYPQWMIGATMVVIVMIACSIVLIVFSLAERNQKATGAGFVAGALGFGALSELARRAEKLKHRP